MLRLPPPGLLDSDWDIANAALAGGCIPDSWKREVMFPIEKNRRNGKDRKTQAQHAD